MPAAASRERSVFPLQLWDAVAPGALTFQGGPARGASPTVWAWAGPRDLCTRQFRRTFLHFSLQSFPPFSLLWLSPGSN